MTLDETLLQKLAEWRPAGGQRQTLNVPADSAGWGVAVTADRCDELSCLLWELHLRRSASVPSKDADLASWAKRIVGQATGLLEPLSVHEIDAVRNEALLRSNDPTRRGEQLYYYELHLRGTNEATMRRFHCPQGGGKREQVPFGLTHEVLAKLVSDLTGNC